MPTSGSVLKVRLYQRSDRGKLLGLSRMFSSRSSIAQEYNLDNFSQNVKLEQGIGN